LRPHEAPTVGRALRPRRSDQPADVIIRPYANGQGAPSHAYRPRLDSHSGPVRRKVYAFA